MSLWRTSGEDVSPNDQSFGHMSASELPRISFDVFYSSAFSVL